MVSCCKIRGNVTIGKDCYVAGLKVENLKVKDHAWFIGQFKENFYLNFFYSEETVIYNNGDCIFSEMYFETCIMINKHICLNFTRRKFSVFFTGINIY